MDNAGSSGRPICDSQPYFSFGDVELQHVYKRVREEINEYPEGTKGEIERLRTLLSEENILVPYSGDDFLLKFLRACKFDVSYAAKVIERYYREKASYPDYHRNLLPSHTRPIFEYGLYDVIRKPNGKNGRATLIIQSSKWDPSKISWDDVLRNFIVILECLAFEEEFQICGIDIIFDAQKVGLHHVSSLSPRVLLAGFNFLQDWSPIRIQNIFVTRENTFFDICYKCFLPFINAELKKRIIFIGSNMEKLHAHIPRDTLPDYLEGTYVKRNDHQDWIHYALEIEETIKKIYGCKW